MKHAKIVGIALLCLSLSGGICAQISDGANSCQYKNMKEAIDTITTREKDHLWQKINWRTSSATALADARKENKPIFVFFVVEQKKASPKAWVGETCDMGKT
jgi:hypothetical protein